MFDQDNNEVKLSDFLGKTVILYFYPKDNTPGCTIQAVDFSSKQSYFDENNIVVLGVSKDSTKSHKNFCEKKNLSITLLSDPDTLVTQDYDVWKEKSMYGKTYFGTERTTFLINNKGIIETVWSKVKAKTHLEEVLTYLKA